MRILIINGPNLNLLGKREPQIYGAATLDSVMQKVIEDFPMHNIETFQSNSEGSIIDRLQEAAYGEHKSDAIILNAGGYTHTSVAIRDAIAAIAIPVVEVHISNIYAREEFRHHSMLSAVCAGTIAGLGVQCYALAVSALDNLCKA